MTPIRDNLWKLARTYLTFYWHAQFQFFG